MALTPDQEEALKILGRMIGGAAMGSAGRGGYDGKTFGPGFAARPGGRVWEVAANPNAMRGDAISDLEAAVDLAEKMKSNPLDFDAGVVFVPGTPQNNAGLVRTPENLESFIRQSEQEHADALKQFMDKPEFADKPEVAAKLGVRAEEALPKWWNDKDPRRPVTPTSSCVRKVRLGPNGDIYVTFGSSEKEYQYEGSSDPVQASKVLQALVTAPSIGRAVNSWTGEWGTAHTYLPKG
jgi:hypothetical protein